MTGKEEQLKERLDVILALALDKPQKTIPCPEDDEFVAWHEKTLTDERREEITSHLAGCTSCYLIWNDLAMVTELPTSFVESAGKVEKQQMQSALSKWFASFFRPGVWVTGGFGTAIVAAMLVFILLPTFRIYTVEQSINGSFSTLEGITVGPLLPSVLPDHKASQPSQYESKSLFPIKPKPQAVWKASTPMQEAFAVGVAKGLRNQGTIDSADAALLSQLPQSLSMSPSNVSPRVWERRKKALIQAGRLAVVLKLACDQSSGLTPSFLSEQESVLQTLAKEFNAYPEQDQFTFFFKSWHRAPAVEKDICGRARALLEMGLKQ